MKSSKIFFNVNIVVFLLFLTLFGSAINCSASWLGAVKDAAIHQYLPAGTIEINIPLGSFTFPNGKTKDFTVGIGSTLFHARGDSINVFYTSTDRGVNIDCEDDTKIIGIDLCEKGKIFPFPNYTPTIYRLTVHPNGTWEIESIPLKDQNNKPITGISNPIPSTENCYDGYGNALLLDSNGLDVEALVRLKDGSFYLGEEYAPSLVHVAPDGRILKRIVPVGLKKYLANATYPIVEALPAVLAKRALNRGIESIAVSPDETTLYFMLQSPLANPDSKTYKASNLVRLFRYDLKTQTVTGEFVYQLDLPDTFGRDKSTNQSDVKISEMTALEDGRLIVLERISKTTKFYEMRIDETKNILGSKYDDPNLTDSLEKKGINATLIIEKKLLFDSDWAGNAASKIEGFTILLDDILVTINDNDFGIEGDTTKFQVIPLNKFFVANIFHINDHHSHIEPSVATLTFNGVSTSVQMGGFARLASKIREDRAKYPLSLLLHAGDAFQGTLYFTQTNGKADLDLMNHLGFDAMVVGNHEFDKGDQVLSNFISGANFPVLAANLTMLATNPLYGKLKPYVIKEFAGQKIAIIGLVTQETPNISSPGKDIEFKQIVDTVNNITAELMSQGIDKIILLTHLGYDADMLLAQKVQNVDAIIGGHSHTLLGDFSQVGLSARANYPQTVESSTGKVCVAQAWEWAKVLGRLEIAWNEKGEVTNCGGMPTLILGDWFQQNKQDVSAEVKAGLLNIIANNSRLVIAPENPETAAIIAPYQKQVLAFRSTVIGTASVNLLHIRVPGKHPSGVNLSNGSLIAPHVADSFYWKTARHNINPDLVITNAGGIRKDILAGNITVESVYELLPFGNTLVPIDMTGAQIKQVLEDTCTNIFEKNGSTGGFPYGSHIRFTVTKSKPNGSYISNLQIKDKITNQWKPLEMNQTYRVITNSYLATGKDGYLTFGTLPKGYDTGFDYAETFMEYVKEQGRLDMPTETGITWID